jgi:quinol monooxygenase YgiN
LVVSDFAEQVLMLQVLTCALAALVCPVAMRSASAQSRAITPRCMSSTASKFCLNVSVFVKPERREEFLKCIVANQMGTLSSEPLAIEYLWGEDVDTLNTFHFFEKYEGRAGFEAHTQSPHFANWLEFERTDPFTEPTRVVFFEEVQRN